jgi:hypothetical protein
MPYITSIIAKVLAFTEAILDNFATVTGSTTIVGACANLTVPTAVATACGTSIATRLAGLAEVGLAAAGYLLAGLLAF